MYFDVKTLPFLSVNPMRINNKAKIRNKMILIRPPQINIKIPPHVNLIPANIFQRKYKTVRIVTTIPLFTATRKIFFTNKSLLSYIPYSSFNSATLNHRLFFHIPLIFTKMLYIMNNNFRLCP